MMKLIITFCFFSVVTPVKSQEENVYLPAYAYTFLNLDTITPYFFNNGCLSVVEIRQNNCPQSLVRFYETGEISLVAKNYKVYITDEEEWTRYGYSAEVLTYYRNGNKRSSYQLDSLRFINGEYTLYDTNGIKISQSRYINDIIYSGCYISKLNKETWLFFYDKGENIYTYLIRDNEIIKIKNSNYRLVRSSDRKLKKLNLMYNLSSEYIQISPGQLPQGDNFHYFFRTIIRVVGNVINYHIRY